MARSKFIKALSVLSYFIFCMVSANPTSEEAELRATRAESPRAGRMPIPPRQIAHIAQTQESCCWSFLNVFCTLMGHAGNSAPHPVLPREK